jgi:hypothetical protein
MLFGKKVESILKNKSGQKAIIEIDNLLTPIFYSKPVKLSDCEKNIVYIEELEREVNNGGFKQFFYNSAGDYTFEIINALKLIGSKIFLGLLEKAIKEFPESNVTKDRDKRQEILGNIEEKANIVWEELDNQFFKYEENIYKLLIDYIMKNIKEFR